MQTKITRRVVDQAKLKPGQETAFVFDTEIKGFGLRIYPSGATYILSYRNRQGRKRQYRLGPASGMTADEARRAARAARAAIDRGEDPAAEAVAARKGLTMAGLAERYLDEHARPKKKAASLRNDESMLARLIVPLLGRVQVDAVTRADVSRLHHSLKATPTQANRAVALLSKMMSLAERWGLRPDGSNPCRHVDRFKEDKRERFLSSEEMQRLGAALTEAEEDGEEMPSAVLALRLLVLTGARRSEILCLTWEEVDLEGRCLRLRDSKTGKKTIPLGAPALELLQRTQPTLGNPYVCPGRKEGQHLVNLTKPWYRIRERAGLPDVRVHDLRHSFASAAASGGVPLAVLGSLMGHKQSQTTQRYAHLAQDARQEAMEQISAGIDANMKGEPGEVRPFRQKGA